MPKTLTAAKTLQLRRLFHCLSSSSSSLQTLTSPCKPTLAPSPSITNPSPSLLRPFNHHYRHFHGDTLTTPTLSSVPIETARAIAAELLRDSEQQDTESIEQWLNHHCCNNPEFLTSQFLVQILNRSRGAGRKVLLFYRWASKQPGFEPDEQFLCSLIDYFGRRKDFKAVQELLLQGKGLIGPKTFKVVVDRLVRAGRPTHAISFFEKMGDLGLNRDRESLAAVVSALCDRGFAGHAERLVKKTADEIFPDESMCDLLVKGWCLDGKLDEARRMVGEISRGGFEIGAVAYNSLLDCVCKLCRRKDPFRLVSEAEKILLEMDSAGVPRNVATFNVLISNLCKLRKTEEACGFFRRMGEWGCSADATTYVMLAKSLYQAARVGEGDGMLDQMKAAGFGPIDIKTYFEFIKILCGIERVEHAMKVFSRMKEDGCEPGAKTYDLLMMKLWTHGRVETANALQLEAAEKGIGLTPTMYKIDPRFARKSEAKKKQKPKRETLPMKMERKRKRLKKLRLSFVKKPKNYMRRVL